MKEIKTQTFFNLGTQRALFENVGGYISKEVYVQEYIKILQAKYNLKKIYRFDLGQNNDGCALEVENQIQQLMSSINIRQYIKNYPNFISLELRQKIADLHNILPDWILLSAGLDQMISIIASSFLELNDRIMINCPSFYLFEEYSKRMGAIPIYLHLTEANGFQWTLETFDQYKHLLNRLNPKLIWIANPNNPTGIAIPNGMMEEIIREAADNYAFVVVDEAYGEYIDTANGVNSSSALLYEYKNLIVLRTFSKAYGLANLRIAYAMSGNEEILKALKIHRDYFPITQISFDLALMAINTIGYLEKVRKRTNERKKLFIEKVKKIPDISYVDSDTNIIMISNSNLLANELIGYLEEHGIIVSRVPGDEHNLKRYIRITLGTNEENNFLLKVL